MKVVDGYRERDLRSRRDVIQINIQLTMELFQIIIVVVRQSGFCLIVWAPLMISGPLSTVDLVGPPVDGLCFRVFCLPLDWSSLIEMDGVDLRSIMGWAPPCVRSW